MDLWKDLFAPVLVIIAAGLAGVFGAWIWGRIKAGNSLPHRMARIEDAVMVNLRATGRQNKVLGAIVDVLVDQKINGNVTDARKAIETSDDEMQTFFQKQATGVRDREVSV